MKINSAEFIKGATQVSRCPSPILPGFVF